MPSTPSSINFIPVILSGGTGSRLWPVSRELHPKPFIRLSDGLSLLQHAFKNAVQQGGVHHLMTVTNRELFFKTLDEYTEVNHNHIATTYILEPFGRNTAAAIAAASLQAAESFGRSTVLLVLPADHLISNASAFKAAVDQALVLANQGKLVTFGIKPNQPETGYGYIEANGHQVQRFVEKPSLAQATEYVASGKFLWNAGIFCFTAGTMLDELAKHSPQILSATQRCLEQSRVSSAHDFKQIELSATLFEHVPDLSIDYAVMEKSDQIAVVPCDIGWSDIGSWTALGELDPADANGNRIQGSVVLHQSTNCTIHSSDRLIGAVGLDSFIVIDTPDALLVVPKDRAQQVKQLVAQLKATEHPTHKYHRTVHRPWGTYTVLESGTGFKIKRIEVKPHASLSLQMHQHRSEHWVVVSGVAKVINGELEVTVNVNESTYIPAGHKHRLMNPSDEACVMIEVQIGGYLEEDDIVRFDDMYGRG